VLEQVFSEINHVWWESLWLD